MKSQIDLLNAIPEKRSFFAIINDYDIKMAICELIDNAIDFWKQSDSSKPLQIRIDVDARQQSIDIRDNAGGVKYENLRLLISPGASSNSAFDATIGVFGVGSKRAVVALAQEVKISSRHKDEKTYLIEFDDSWLGDEEWKLPVYETDNINEGETLIKLARLRKAINPSIEGVDGGIDSIENTEKDLRVHLSSTYAKFITEQNIQIALNEQLIKPILFDTDWTYPPSYCPKTIKLKFKVEENRVLNVSITGGLLQEGAASDGEHGVYLYCNNRLITKAHRSPQVGYVTGQAGSPDHLYVMRVIIEMHGSAKYMPWDSSKTRANFNSEVLKRIQKKIIEVVSHYAKISRSLESDRRWHTEVFPFTDGEIEVLEIDVEEKSIHKYLPPIPKSRPRYRDQIKTLNKDIARSKPWTQGLYETIIAYDAISKLQLTQKNRILLITLDSAIEIAFKEYLVNDADNYYSDNELQKIFKQRHLVYAEIKKYVSLEDEVWNKVKYFNGLRNELIHKRATVSIDNSQIDSFYDTVLTILNTLYGLEFS